MKKFATSLLLLALLLTTGCGKEDPAPSWQVRKVAVVLPMGYGLQEHWQNTVEMASNGIQEVQKKNILNLPGEPQAQLVKMEFEWYDEEKEDMEALGEKLAQREDIVAVIGGEYSANAVSLAAPLCKARKPFFTLATTDELIRGYSTTGSLWAMVESDITQCEILLSRALYYGAKRVSLIADGESIYGKTFVDWFAFQAQEMELEIGHIYNYRENNLEELARQASGDPSDILICVPTDTEDLLTMETIFRKEACLARRLYSDSAYGQEILDRCGDKVEGIEGITIGAAPETGFSISYEIQFGKQPTHGVPQVYDAIVMLGWALIDQLNAGDTGDLNEYLKEEATLGIAGACGPIEFDHVVYTNVLSTTYYHFMLYQGRFITLNYVSSTGSHRTDATLGAWNWQADKMQEFDDASDAPDYPALDQKWALLVAGSSEWKNYRHQADVLAMYQILKKQGYDDDHIVLVMEDDLAQNPANPYKGVVRVRPGGSNVREGAVIDYHPSDLVPSDLKNILMGNRSERLPHVIGADSDDNILIFWSGHGSPGRMEWLENGIGFTDKLARETFQEMNENRKYRKILCLIETCYSGSVFSNIVGIPGVLAFTAAGPNETSKADVYDADMGIWMSNRFSATLEDCINNDPDIPFRDLYYRLFTNTVGSHVMVYNAPAYGNLFRETMREYLK